MKHGVISVHPLRLKRIFAHALLCLLAIAALRDAARLNAALPWRTMHDFPIFYCAGWALDHHASPYTYEPMRTCQHAFGDNDILRRNPGMVAPAPQPPYDFVPLAALAKLSFQPARVVAVCTLLGAMALAAVALGLLGVPALVVVAALLLSVGYVDISEGQIVPLVLAALCLCGLCLARGRDRLAGCMAVLTMMEPHLGAPVVLTVFAFVPRARLAALATAAALAGASVVTVGPRAAIAYLTRIVPLHALAQVHFPLQYSLTYVLSAFGMAPAIALVLGGVSYVVLTFAALIVGPGAARALGRRELLAFLPGVCAVFAGPFIHVIELSFAIPAALVLAIALEGRAKTLAAFALCGLAIPWVALWSLKKLFLLGVLAVATILTELDLAIATTVAAVAIFAAALFFFNLHPPNALPSAMPPPRTSYAPKVLAQVPYAYFMRYVTSNNPLWMAIKIPTWLSLAVLLGIATRRREPIIKP